MAPIAPLKMLVAPAAKAITRLGSSMTYDDVPCAVERVRTAAPTWATSPTLHPSSHLIPSSVSSNPRCI